MTMGEAQDIGRSMDRENGEWIPGAAGSATKDL